MESIEILRECAAGKRGHGDTMDLVADEFGCPVPVHSYVLGYVADAIEKELKERYMELPVDADGVPIHVGDEMDCGEHFGVQEVEGFIHGAVAFTVCDPQPARICTRPAHMTRHYHKPTRLEGLRDERLDARRGSVPHRRSEGRVERPQQARLGQDYWKADIRR